MTDMSSQKQVITETITPNFENLNNITLENIGTFLKTSIMECTSKYDLASEPLVNCDPLVNGGLIVTIKRYESDAEVVSRLQETQRIADRRKSRLDHIRTKQRNDYIRLKDMFEVENQNNN